MSHDYSNAHDNGNAGATEGQMGDFQMQRVVEAKTDRLHAQITDREELISAINERAAKQASAEFDRISDPEDLGNYVWETISSREPGETDEVDALLMAIKRAHESGEPRLLTADIRDAYLSLRERVTNRRAELLAEPEHDQRFEDDYADRWGDE